MKRLLALAGVAVVAGAGVGMTQRRRALPAPWYRVDLATDEPHGCVECETRAGVWGHPLARVGSIPIFYCDRDAQARQWTISLPPNDPDFNGRMRYLHNLG